VPDPIYALRGVQKSFGGRLVLDVAELELEATQFTAVQGPNGAGKTTLLSILALLLSPDQGRVIYRGSRVPRAGGELTHLRREVTLVAQSAYLFESSALANVAYGLKARGMERRSRAERAEAALERVGLAGFGPRRARKLSGGETQRVALARALVLRPRVLLLDEPFANLDPESAAVFERVLAGLPGEGCTVIMVSHAREQARRLASRVVVMEGGLVVSG